MRPPEFIALLGGVAALRPVVKRAKQSPMPWISQQ
jgi:hypothetical protein